MRRRFSMKSTGMRARIDGWAADVIYHERNAPQMRRNVTAWRSVHRPRFNDLNDCSIDFSRGPCILALKDEAPRSLRGASDRRAGYDSRETRRLNGCSTLPRAHPTVKPFHASGLAR